MKMYQRGTIYTCPADQCFSDEGPPNCDHTRAAARRAPVVRGASFPLRPTPRAAARAADDDPNFFILEEDELTVPQLERMLADPRLPIEAKYIIAGEIGKLRGQYRADQLKARADAQRIGEISRAVLRGVEQALVGSGTTNRFRVVGDTYGNTAVVPAP